VARYSATSPVSLLVPERFGFKLHEGWGKAAFWFWISGFFVAFMPLYALGFMGMTRRLNATTNPWVPYLYVAMSVRC
jgi:cytochrome o ubiquinol oxidase subunit 1